jgi:hypothetical protein
MCCGSKRSAWRSASAPARSPRAAQLLAPVASASAPTATANINPVRPHFAVTTLHYTESAPIRLTGPITGRVYAFSGADPLQEVDVRDAAVFARSDRFRGSAP